MVRVRVRPTIERLEQRQVLSAFYHNLAAGPYYQDWTNLYQITQDDNWGAVAGVIGYRGDNIVRRPGANPEFLHQFNGPTGAIVDVMANQTSPDTNTLGGVAEFHLTDPVVALQGSSVADAPFIMLHVSTLGTTNINISYKLRDIDGSPDDAKTQVALQYRIGDTGEFANVPGSYVADATTGPSQAMEVTPVSVLLPTDAENQPKVQIRIMTADALGNDEWVGVDDIAITATVVSPSTTLRVATYNVAASTGNPAFGVDTLIQAIGNESSYGASRPIDVLAIQEVESQATTTQYIVNLLNAIYGAGAYARGFANGATTGSGTQGLIYNTGTIQLLGEKAVGTSSTSGQPRQAMRYHLRPILVGSAGDFYLYNSHYKADDDSTSEQRRLDEAEAIRADADALGPSVNILYAGDFNMYTSNEEAYQELLSTGNGQAFDPINRPGNWHDNPSFIDVFTQAPAENPPVNLTGGGIDDRFDFHLATGELFDGIGLDYIPGSYHAFANNGSVPINKSINYFTNTALLELANRTGVLGLLTTVSDHLPAVADFFFVPASNPMPPSNLSESSAPPALVTRENMFESRTAARESNQYERPRLIATGGPSEAAGGISATLGILRARPFLFSRSPLILTMNFPIDWAIDGELK